MKIVVRGLVAMLGLSVLCIVLVAAFFNPNRYRGQIEAWIGQQTGRNFTLDGELHWAWWPQLAIALPAARLGAAPGNAPGNAKTQDFLNWESASISVSWWPLLSGRVQLGTVHVRGLRLALARNTRGEGNWQDLLDRWATTRPPSRWRFDQLAALQLKDAQVQFIDALSQRTSTLQIDELRTHVVRFDAPIDLEISAQLQTRQAAQSVTLPWHLHAQWQIDAALQRVQVATLVFDGTLNSSDLFAATASSLPLTLSLQNCAWQAPSSLAAPILTVQIGQARAAGRMQINTVGTYASPVQTPQFETSLQIDVPNLREWLASLGIQVPATRDTTVLQMLSMSVAARGDAAQLQLQLPSVQLDQTRLSGRVELHFDTPAYRGELQADALNLDRYLPRDTARSRSQRVAVVEPIPLAWLRGLPVQGRLLIEHAQWQGVQARHFSIELDGP